MPILAKTHWMALKHRLDRSFGKRFGDKACAAEELGITEDVRAAVKYLKGLNAGSRPQALYQRYDRRVTARLRFRLPRKPERLTETSCELSRSASS